jgi:hypothetical protein
MIFDKFVFEEKGTFYLDLINSDVGIDVDVGDYIKFTYEGNKISAKVINKIDNLYELYILEFIL